MRVAVIGAGLYGCYAARIASSLGHDVTIFDASGDLGSYSIASTVNQARVHGGYHYPRSISTAKEARSHREEFEKEFEKALLPKYPQVYAIPKFNSLCTSSQFEQFCERAGAPLQVTSDEILTCRVEKAYLTDERAIDTVKMMKIARSWLIDDHISFIREEVNTFKGSNDSVIVINESHEFDKVINCSYASVDHIQMLFYLSQNNELNAGSLATYEYCEIVLLKDTHNSLKGKGFTFMDGPFCSIMPFTNELYSLTSVSFTPVFSSNRSMSLRTDANTFNSSAHMLQELSLYIDPAIVRNLEVYDTIATVKAIPALSDVDDSRNVCYRIDPSNRFISILGGKLTAVYEITSQIEKLLE